MSSTASLTAYYKRSRIIPNAMIDRPIAAVSGCAILSWAGLHPEGRGFKSRTAHHLRTQCGAVVQLVRTPACHAFSMFTCI